MDSIYRKIRGSLSDTFVRNNLIFFVGSLGVAFFNYLYHPIMSRLLTVESFGEVQALFSIMLELLIVSNVFWLIVVNITSNHDLGDKKYLISKLQKVAIYLTLSLFFLVVLFAGRLNSNLQFTSIWPFIILAFVLAVSALVAFRTAILQGDKDFKQVSILGFIQSVLRLLLGAVFVLLGAGTLGAMFGLLLGQVIALYYAFVKTKEKLPSLSLAELKNGVGSHQKENEELTAELRYGLFIFVILFSVTALYTFDVVLVKKYFDPTIAGLYSGLATVARIIFFATSSVSGVLLASVRIDAKKEEKIRILQKSLLFLAAVGLPLLAVFSLFPTQIIKILIGPKYLTFAGLLPLLSFSIFLTSLLNLFFYYAIALRRYRTAPAGIVAMLAIFLLSLFHHETIRQLIINFIIGNALGLFTLSATTFFNKEKE